jgi:uncharacterized OsmC-like protein
MTTKADHDPAAAVPRFAYAGGHLAWLVLGHDAARQALGDHRISKDMLAALKDNGDVVAEGLPGPAYRNEIKETPMTITDRPIDNGVDVQALLGAREALSAAPGAAQFAWRASCTWRDGTHSQSTVAGFTGLGAEQRHRSTYEFDVDHPECFSAKDNGATPVEYVLVGLAGCLTAGVASVAQFRGIQLRSVTATIEGQMNILGMLGADPDVRNGFEAITVRFVVDADASRDDVEALVAQSQKRSPVYDIVTNPTSVLVELA